MDNGQAGEANKQKEQITQGSNVAEADDEVECDQVAVMYEDDVLEEIEEDDVSPENGLKSELEDLDMEEGGEGGAEGGEGFVPLREDAVQCFKEHAGSVFCVSLHPSGELACSGGEDDKAYVWKVADGTTLFVCQGHKDSVTCTGFSHDGKYVATADMGGLIQVWLTSSGERVWSFETGDIEWLQWHSQAHVLLAGTSDGGGWMWKIPSGDCKTFQGHSMRNTCGALATDGRRVALGYEDGVVKIWDLKEGNPLVSIAPPSGHSASVTSLAAHSDNVLLLSGSEDSTAKLINTNTGKVLVTFSAGFAKQVDSGTGASEGQENEISSVEVVGFSPTNPMAVTGSLSGVLGIWDIPTQKLRQKCIHKDGVVRLHCSSHLSAPLVLTGCLDGVVRRWDLRSGLCVREWHGHSDQILDVAVSRDDVTILSAANDGTVRVFRETQ